MWLDPLQRINLIELLANLHETIVAFPLAFLIIGVLYSFFGRELFDAFNVLIGGFIGMVFMNEFISVSGILLPVLLIGSFLIGGFVGFFAPYVLIGIIGFSLGLGVLVGVSPVLGIIIGIFCAAIAVVLFRLLLPAVTALIGSILAGTALYEITGNPRISVIIGLLLFIIGAVFQFSTKEDDEDEVQELKDSESDVEVSEDSD